MTAIIKYRKAKFPASIQPPQPDYWIEVDGKIVGYVHADRASRQSGTCSRWVAYDNDGKRITPTICGTFRRLKEHVALLHNDG